MYLGHGTLSVDGHAGSLQSEHQPEESALTSKRADTTTDVATSETVRERRRNLGLPDHPPIKANVPRGLLNPFRAVGALASSLRPDREAPFVVHGVYYGIVGALVMAEVVEWPIAVLVAAGHALAQSHSTLCREVGEGLGEA